ASPFDPFAANNLAWLLATAPKPSPPNIERAIELTERAVKLTKGSAVNTGTLAVAYAASGRFDDAAIQAEKARSLVIQQGDSKLADLLAEMLESYRKGRVFR